MKPVQCDCQMQCQASLKVGHPGVFFRLSSQMLKLWKSLQIVHPQRKDARMGSLGAIIFLRGGRRGIKNLNTVFDGGEEVAGSLENIDFPL